MLHPELVICQRFIQLIAQNFWDRRCEELNVIWKKKKISPPFPQGNFCFSKFVYMYVNRFILQNMQYFCIRFFICYFYLLCRYLFHWANVSYSNHAVPDVYSRIMQMSLHLGQFYFWDRLRSILNSEAVVSLTLWWLGIFSWLWINLLYSD